MKFLNRKKIFTTSNKIILLLLCCVGMTLYSFVVQQDKLKELRKDNNKKQTQIVNLTDKVMYLEQLNKLLEEN